MAFDTSNSILSVPPLYPVPLKSTNLILKVLTFVLQTSKCTISIEEASIGEASVMIPA